MRRINGLGLVFMIGIILLIEYYAFTAFKFAIKNVRPSYKNLAIGLYVFSSILWFLMFFAFDYIRTADANKSVRSFVIIYFMGLLISKVLIASILLIDDLRRFVYLIMSSFYSKQTTPLAIQDGMTRSAFLTKFAILFGGSVFATMLYGMTNRYNYNLKKIKIAFANLPSAFKGLKIIQISDIHSGSFNDLKAVEKGVELIMAQNPDLILFTGDLVNNKSDEMNDYIDVFSKLSAPFGVYSIFGNHDYGDYISIQDWGGEDAKKQNLTNLKDIHAKMGWRLLLDEHIAIEKDGEHIGLIGVENISASRGFHSYGNLQNAYTGAEKYPFKILMSHDPSHWDHETTQAFKDIDLTLSGHTHGMQFGVEIPWLKWSPVQYVYKRWAGLYKKDEQYLYVNRGYGFLGYPGRVGILPEITLIELT